MCGCAHMDVCVWMCSHGCAQSFRIHYKYKYKYCVSLLLWQQWGVLFVLNIQLGHTLTLFLTKL